MSVVVKKVAWFSIDAIYFSYKVDNHCDTIVTINYANQCSFFFRLLRILTVSVLLLCDGADLICGV
jgi:hypothetical protein